MRLGVAPGGTGARQDRALQLRRDRAAAPTLRVMFPALEQLRLELRFEGPPVSTPVPQVHVLHPPARAYFAFPCPYADCDGQFDLTAAVSSVVKDPPHRSEGVLECSGARAYDSASKRRCRLHLRYTVTATFAAAS
jgi:hypothetical protein